MSNESNRVYMESLKAIQAELQVHSEKPQTPLASHTFQKFFYESSNYLASLSGGRLTDSCKEWYNVTSQALLVIVRRLDDWNPKYLSHKIVLTCLCHYVHHLTKFDEVPVEWSILLGSAGLELVAASLLTANSQPELISKLALNLCGCLSKAGQKLNRDNRAIAEAAHELQMIAHALRCMDTSNQSSADLLFVREYLSKFLLQVDKFSDEAVKKIFVWAVKVFTLQSRSAYSDVSQVYFVHLFRIISDQRGLCENLLACKGNLYELDLPQVKLSFPLGCINTWTQKQCFLPQVEKENHSAAQEIICSVLTFTFKLSSLANVENLTTIKDFASMDLNYIENLQKMIDTLEPQETDMLHKSTNQAISESLSALLQLKFDPKLLPPDILMLLYQLVAHSIPIFIQEISMVSKDSSKANHVTSRLRSTYRAEKIRQSVMIALLQHDVTDKVIKLATLQKTAIKKLFDLSQKISKISFLTSSCSSQVDEILQSSVMALRSFGKLLYSQKRDMEATELLSPLIPFKCKEQLYPYIGHHEFLAKSYRRLAQPDKIKSIITWAAETDISLLTDDLISILVRLAVEEPNLPILEMFESCQENPKKHAMVLVKVVRQMLSSKSSYKCAMKVLKHLTTHPGLEASDHAVYMYYLAEVSWFAGSEAQDKMSTAGESLNLLKDCTLVLKSLPLRTLDDVLAQAANLYWELLYRYTCLEAANTEDYIDKDSPSKSSSTMTSATDKRNSSGLPFPLEAASTPKSTKPGRSFKFAPLVPEVKQKEVVNTLADSRQYQVDSWMLMSKSIDCLDVWVKWFIPHQHDLLNWGDGKFRMARSLSFLNKVSEVALLNHNIMAALMATCYAKNLAAKLQDKSLVQRLTTRLLSMMAELGVKYDEDSDLYNGEKDLFDEDDDVFMRSLGLDQNMHPLDLVYLADYYYKIGEINKYANVHCVILDLIEKARTKGPNTSLAVAMMRRLSAGYHSSPLVIDNNWDPEMVCETYPTIQVGEAVGYIKDVIKFYLGKDYKIVDKREMCEESWQVINEYLHSLKFVGELFMYVGNIKYARTYYSEGLKMADSFMLGIWSTVFLSKLTQVALNYYDTTDQAEDYLKRAIGHVERHGVHHPESSRLHMSIQNVGGVSNCSAERSVKQNGCSFCTLDINSAEARRNSLLWAESQVPFTPTREDNSVHKLLCYHEECSHRFKPSVAKVVTELMWLQAEIARNLNEGTSSNNLVLQSLHVAGCCAQRIKQYSFIEAVEQMLLDIGVPWTVADNLCNTNYEWVLETKVRLAETYYLLLSAGVKLEGVTADVLQDLMDQVVASTAPSSCTHTYNVLIASALLLKTHVKYLGDLQQPTESVMESDNKVIEWEVKEARSCRSYWDGKRTLEFTNSVMTVSDEISTKPTQCISKPLEPVVAISATPFIPPHSTPTHSKKRTVSIFNDSITPHSTSSIRPTLNVKTNLLQSAAPSQNVKTLYPQSRRTKTVPTKEEKCLDMTNISASLHNIINTPVAHKENYETLTAVVNRKRQSPSALKISVLKTVDVVSNSPELEGKPKDVNDLIDKKKAKSCRCTRQKGRVPVKIDKTVDLLSQSTKNVLPSNEKCSDDELVDIAANLQSMHMSTTIDTPVIQEEQNKENCQKSTRLLNRKRQSPSASNKFVSKPAKISSGLEEKPVGINDVADTKKVKTSRATRQKVNVKLLPNNDPIEDTSEPRVKKSIEENVDMLTEVNTSTNKLRKNQVTAKDNLIEASVEHLGLERSRKAENGIKLRKIAKGRQKNSDLEPAKILVEISNTLSSPQTAAGKPRRNTRASRQKIAASSKGVDSSPVEIPRGRKKCSTQEVPCVAAPLKSQAIKKDDAECEPEINKHKLHDDVSLLPLMEDSLKKLQHFPHSFLYRQLAQSLAKEECNKHSTIESKSKLMADLTKQQDIAAWLTESMHVSFQHLMIRNLGSKLRCLRLRMKGEKDKSMDYAELQGEELAAEVKAMTEALKKLQPSSGVDTLRSRLSDIPKDWTVVQLTVASHDPLNPGKGQLFVTRLTSDQCPLTVEIPATRWPWLMRATRLYETTIIHTDNVVPQEYWADKYKKEADMQNLVVLLQDVFLAGHKWLLKGRADLCQHVQIAKYLDQAACTAADFIQQQQGYTVDTKTLKVILEVLLCANEDDIDSLVRSMWPKDVAELVSKATLQLQAQVVKICKAKVMVNRGPVVLILDKSLNRFPWESMPDFQQDIITRVPSLSALHALLTWHGLKKNSSYQRGVSRSSFGAVIDPEANLSFTASFLQPELEKYPGWTCLTKKAPTVEDLRTFLTKCQVYLYSGHGWGSQFVGGDDIQMFDARAVALLMGCNSGSLNYRPRVDGDGAPLYFLLAGCPAVVGNLWRVTDKDIDKLTSKLASEWLSKKRPMTLNHILTVARKVCKLLGLNGYSPVVYGLPVLMN